MATFGEWLSARISEYSEALNKAKDNYDNYITSGSDPNFYNDFVDAWITMSSDSDINVYLPGNSTAFQENSPTASQDDINAVMEWFVQNLSVASQVGLAIQVSLDANETLNGLSTAGVVGGNKQRWKGQQTYTFANGILVGKNSSLIAALGVDTDEVGEDVLNYFDGIKYARGTQTRGVSAFGGDVVISGSLQGNNGVIIIDDVIQLETGVALPAGIGVDDQGRIHLRQRGEGFFDLIDQTEVFATNAKEEAILESKVWVGSQDTKSIRYGQTLIPNGNFAAIEVVGTNEYPRGVASIGTTDRHAEFTTTNENGNLSTDYGVLKFSGDGTGILMPSVDVTEDRYRIVVRFAADGNSASAVDGISSGLFISMHETSDNDTTVGAATHIFYPGGQTGNTIQSGITAHTGNTTENILNDSPDGVTIDGSSLSTSWDILSFQYTPTAGTTKVSFAAYTMGFNGYVYLDYAVMVANPYTNVELQNLLGVSSSAISSEAGSLVTDASCDDATLHTALTDTTLTLVSDGGDQNNLPAGTTIDNAISVVTGTTVNGTSVKGGIESTPFNAASSKYTIGYRVKSVGASFDVSAAIKEISGGSTMGGIFTPTPSSTSTIIDKDSFYLDGTNDEPSPQNIGQVLSLPADTWVTILLDHEVTYGAITSLADLASSSVTALAPILYVLDPNATVLVDYVYAAVNSTSLNLVQDYANEAYSDAETFVTAINEQLIREQGSIIPNASMAMPAATNTARPAGYFPYGSSNIDTIEYGSDQTGDDKCVVVNVGTQSTSGIISPAFSLTGDTDRYSVAVSIKTFNNVASGNVTVSVAYSSTPLTASQSAIANTSVFSGVQTGATKNVLATDQISSGYSSILATWDRGSGAPDGVASIIIECNVPFVVDYILVRTQSCSFDLADTQAEQRRDEAIAQVQNYSDGLTDAMNQEAGSLLGNPGFTAWKYDSAVAQYQMVKHWASTGNASATPPLRAIKSSEDAGNGLATGEYVLSRGQRGSMAVISGGVSSGILSSPFVLPPGLETTDANGNQVTSTGRYTVAFKVRMSAAGGYGLKILAHEAYSIVDRDFIYDNSDIQAGVSVHSTNNKQPLDLINLTTADAEVGYNGDTTIEWIPVDNNETQGDTDSTVSNYDDWYTITGTYTPSSQAKSVSFELKIDGRATSDLPDLYIDYANLIQQTIDADFADALAQARAEKEADDIYEERAIEVAETASNLLYNGNFSLSTKTRGTTKYAKGWSPAKNTSGVTVTGPVNHLSYARPTVNSGLVVANSANCNGVISKPFRILNDDYKIEIKAKASTTSTMSIVVFYWSTDDLTADDNGEECIALIDDGSYSVHDPLNYSIQTGCQHDVLLTWSPSTSSFLNQRKIANWDADAVNAEWAAIGVFQARTSGNFEILNISCKKNVRGLGTWRGKSITDKVDEIYSPPGHKYYTDYINNTSSTFIAVPVISSGLSFSNPFSTVAAPTAPVSPPIHLQDCSIAPGHSLRLKTNTYTTSTSSPSSSVVTLTNNSNGSTHYSNDEVSDPDYRNNNLYRGLVYAGESETYDDPSDGNLLGVSYYRPTVTGYIGVSSNQKYLWFKPGETDTTGTGVQFFDNNSNNRWTITYDDTNNEDRLRFGHGSTSNGTLRGFVADGGTGAANDADQQMNFTGQHHCSVLDLNPEEQHGLIVVSSGQYNNMGENKSRIKPSINESLPVVQLSTKPNQKSVFGVLSNKFDDNGEATWKNGNWGSIVHLHDEDRGRFAINSLGEGAIWITNINGNLENGDYITTSEIPGYGMKQDDDLLHNYTVAKITQDCDFELDNPYYDCVEFEYEGTIYRKAFVGCTYHCG